MLSKRVKYHRSTVNPPTSLFIVQFCVAPTRMGNLNQVHKVLEAGFNGIPQPRDTEKYLFSVTYCLSSRTLMTLIANRPKYYVPRNPYATPAYYPQQPLASFDSAAMYARFDPETLFYIFYFHAGTYQQWALNNFEPSSMRLMMHRPKVSCRARIEAPVMAFPYKVLDLVPTAFGATSNNRRVRTRRICLF